MSRSNDIANITSSVLDGVTKAEVGLGNVDNTADTAKPVSTAQQSAIDLKANIASPTFTGTTNVSSGVTLPSNPTIALGSNATGFTGIKVYDNWRLTTTLSSTYLAPSNSSEYIKDNLERNDTTGVALIGSAMTVDSNGVWTFPMTGMYKINFNAQFYRNLYATYIGTTIDNIISGTLQNMTRGYTNLYYEGGDTGYTSSYLEAFFDVVDTSTHKVAFRYLEKGGTGTDTHFMWGSTSYNATNFSFMRIGDT